MKTARLLFLGVLSLLLASCGGSPSSTPSFGFATPTKNSTQAFSVTDIDPVSTSTNVVTQTITGVNSDGSFSFSETIAPGTVASGTHFQPTNSSADGQGHVLAVTFNPGTVSERTCTYSPHGPGPDFPLTVGATWQLTFTETCGAQTSTYTQSGHIVGTESITVAGGTFTAIKLESTLSLPIGLGANASLTRWLDATDGHPIQTIAKFDYGTANTLTTHTLLSETSVLQNQN
jgi:hypothetical protein